MWDSSHTHTYHMINQIGASQSPLLKSLTSSLWPTLRVVSSSPHEVTKLALIPYVTTLPQLCRYYPLWHLYSSRFCSPSKHTAVGEKAFDIKGKSFLINTFSCASLGDVGFHGMQDHPFWVTTTYMYKHD